MTFNLFGLGYVLKHAILFLSQYLLLKCEVTRVSEILC